MHDPTQLNRQGPDVGDSYRSAIFYTSDDQRHIAEEVKAKAQAMFDKSIVTEVTEAVEFYPAEEYHQKFFQKTGIGACHVPYAPVK
jgi:methionine-S-sulfoxide reductase